MYLLELEIEGLPKFTSNANQHWKARWLEAKKWKKLVTTKIHFKNKPESPLEKARLTLTRFAHGRKPDADNLRSSFKHVIDALVESGVLADDRPDVIGEPAVFHEPAKPGQGKIRIVVEGVA